MQVEIRRDLNDVEALISRLLAIGEEFRAKDDWWSHLKNKEDWGRNVHAISDGMLRAKIERIYCDGRDMGLFMSDALLSINYDISRYPTLTSIVERFNGTWVDSDLQYVIEEATQAHESLALNCWAFREMVTTFQDQLNLAGVVRQTLNLLKESDLYKIENGIPVKKDTSNVTIKNVSGSNISIGSSHVKQSTEGSEAVFNQLIEAIKASDIEHKEPLVTAAHEMQRNCGSEGFGAAYKRFIASAANHMTVVAPFLPALTTLL